MVGSVLLLVAAAGLVTHDLTLRWNTQARLQIAATRMAVAAAVYLPGAPERAAQAAARSAARMGLPRAEVVDAGPGADRMSFTVSLKASVPVLVLGLLGSSGSVVSVAATATVHQYAPPGATGQPIVLSRTAPGASPPIVRG